MFRAPRILITTVATFSFGQSGLAAGSSVGVNFTSLPNSNTEQFELNATTNRLGENLTLRLGLGVKKYDLEKIMIREINGREFPLSTSETRDKAAFGSFQAQKNWRAWGAAASWEGSLGSDPFASQRLSLTGDWRNYETGSTMGANWGIGERVMPENSFLDRDFVSKRRPQKIHQQSMGVFGEQLLLAATKIRIQAGVGMETAERPQNRSWEARFAQGFRDGDVALHLFAGNLEEVRDKSLKNERGYFSVQHMGASLLTEPILDQIIEMTVQEQKEGEFDPRVDERREILSRTFGLGVNLKNGQLKIKTGLNYSVTDQKESFWGIKGDVQWELD